MEKFEQFELKVFSGYLTDDPNIQYFESEKCKCTFSIPLKKNKDDKPIFLNAECWHTKLCEKIADNYKKGSFITILGSFKENEYNGKTYINFVISSIL